ncbi:hypothetical protein CHS0354_021145 [Potamilus streckersoni]|uniref:Caveolin n=1 Tax=Potamilus streckersoni TaxID=2493646 RepID=A0AAE0T3H9_9BIVA|nr:hypothetical protein CHS0354_021145 [Potamilus streckersoni]
MLMPVDVPVTSVHIANNQISYEDVFAEPDGVVSLDYIWQAAFNCFKCSKNTCYKFLSTLCGVCCAFCWGCEFAVLAFHHVWCLTPCLRTFDIVMGYIQKIVGTISTCCIAPFCEACGMIFSNIKVVKLQT